MNALPWHGGKFYQRKWVNEVLGPNKDRKGGIYCEPFFGMGSVLLGRDAAPIEIVSDINGRVVNWWRVLQTDVDALAAKVENTPSSREVFDDCSARLDEGSSLERAWRFHVVVVQGRSRTDSNRCWKPSVGPPWLSFGYGAKLRQIALRIRKISIETRCGTSLLKWTAKRKNAIVYCDPPYWGKSNTSFYGEQEEVDLTDLLLAQQGRSAVSGYGDTWDHLGWERHTRTQPLRTAQGYGRRTEVLWVNGK